MKKTIAYISLWGLLTTNMIYGNDNHIFLERFQHLAPKTVGLKEFPTINDHFYRGDCSGFIAFLFHLTGFNLKSIYGEGANGVAIIWDGLEKQGYLLETKTLQSGDIIFFDNTYDKNKNKRKDDQLTHIGVVESIDEHNTITYLHYTSKGVVRSKMNLDKPDVFRENSYTYNDVLRSVQKGEQLNGSHLSGTLYRGAARIYFKKKEQKACL